MKTCFKCGIETNTLLPIETDVNIYYYCRGCIKEAQDLLSMKIAPNKDERALLKKMRKFLKYEKNN